MVYYNVRVNGLSIKHGINWLDRNTITLVKNEGGVGVECAPGKAALLVLRLRLAAASVPVAFVCGVIAAFSPAASIVLALVSLNTLLLLAFWYLPNFLRSCRISSKGKICLVMGVFLRKRMEVPVLAATWWEKVQTPLSGRLGLCSVRVYAVRRRIVLPLLERRDADRICDELKIRCEREGKD